MKKRTALFIAYLCLMVMLPEFVVRVFFAGKLGPRMLLYGTGTYRYDTDFDQSTHELGSQRFAISQEKGASVESHANRRRGYTTYFPTEVRYHEDVDTGERFRVTINSHGFRGKDFSVEKAPGVVRVVTLGASSTFSSRMLLPSR